LSQLKRSAGDRAWTIAIVGFAIVLRMIAAVVWQFQCEAVGKTLRFGDSYSYWTIARNLVVDGQYQFGSSESKIFRAPVYPMVLAPFAWCEHSLGGGFPQWPFVLAARLLGCLLGGFVVWLVMRWTRDIAGENASRCSGLLAASYCGAVGMSIFVLSEAVATPLIVLSMWLLWRSTKGSNEDQRFGGYGLTVGSGIAFALACLARPSWGLWPLVAFPFLLIASKVSSLRELRQRVFSGIVFLVVVVLAMAPWWVRNFRITGKFVPTTLQVGASLYDGWHAGASGSSDENMDFSMQTMNRIVQEESMLANRKEQVESTLEWRIDRRLNKEAWDWARENPSDVLKLGLIKFRKTWSPVPQARELSNRWVRWWEAISYVLIVILSAMGIYRLRGDRKRLADGLWMVLPCVYLAILHMVFVGSVRYRQPGVLVLCGLAGIGLASLWLKKDWERRDADGEARESKQ
jgi:4-amino-4-deoxy-L-arabinose transferase-like glycosyltransferase